MLRRRSTSTATSVRVLGGDVVVVVHSITPTSIRVGGYLILNPTSLRVMARLASGHLHGVVVEDALHDS